ncbi:MAG: four helix bundle protein [bacterium]
MSDDKYRLDDFELYQLSRKFRQNVYRLIKQLPSEERYCLDPQMKRAIVSITNNIAEGHGRWHYQENMRFCRIARGSIEEILDDIIVSYINLYTNFLTLELYFLTQSLKE